MTVSSQQPKRWGVGGVIIKAKLVLTVCHSAVTSLS